MPKADDKVHHSNQESQGYTEQEDDMGDLETDKGVERHEEQDEQLLVVWICLVESWLCLPECGASW